jgi:protein-L-isoaspartate(D-aspartate) O-methyltransferase
MQQDALPSRPTVEAELAVVRSAYAKQIMFASGVNDPRIETALANLRREAFLQPGPWPIMQPLHSGYRITPDDNPVYLYQDVLVGIVPEKGLNNGQPSFLIFLISLGKPSEGEKIVHIGAGQGYYTAVMAELVGKTGHVTAIEYEHDLAVRATKNLSAVSQVRVLEGDGTTIPLEPCDVVYVNAGAVRPMNTWLDALKDGGRLVLPLTTSYTTSDGYQMTRGGIFLIERQGRDFLAHWKSGTGIYPCFGGRDAPSEAVLNEAFEKGGWQRVTRLYRSGDIEPERCWVRGPDWSLVY